MAKKDILETRNVSALYFVQHPFRSDLNFFSFDLDQLRKELDITGVMGKAAKGYLPAIYEVQFWLKKPIFKKYTLAQLKKLNLL